MRNPDKMDFAGIEYVKAKDPLLNLEYIKWLGKAKTYKDLPVLWARQPKTTVKVAKNYWLPAQFLTVIERLDIHGVQYETIKKPVSISATQLTAGETKFQDKPFEGHQVPATTFTEKLNTVVMPAGSFKIPSDQPLGSLVVALLDPRAPDSFFSWGFFNQMFQRTEYIESYAMIPLAHQMIENEPALENEFLAKKKSDEKFASDQRLQMSWFYERSKYYDQHYLKYPILLEH